MLGFSTRSHYPLNFIGHDMETISVGFSYNKKSFLSEAIKSLDQSPFSHVYLRKKSKYGEYVYQASGLQVNFMNIDIFSEHNTIVEEYEFNLDDAQKDKILAFFIKYAGAEYQTCSLFKLLVILLGRRVGMEIKIKDGDRKKFICSELGAFFCEEILGIDIPGELDFITPKGLNKIVKIYGQRII